MKELLFPLLNAEDIDVRVGTVVKDKKTNEEKGFTLLLYKDARVDMKALDEVIGWNHWKREHKELKGVIYCGVSIYDEETKEWITKWDAGSESNTEKEKGESSDSFKRACVNFGIGRELYTAPFIYISCEKYGKFERFKVKEIGYNENREINHLVIIDSKGKEAFKMGNPIPKQEEKVEHPLLTLDTLNWCMKLDISLKNMAIYLKKPENELTDEDCQPFIDKRKKARGITDED